MSTFELIVLLIAAIDLMFFLAILGAICTLIHLATEEYRNRIRFYRFFAIAYELADVIIVTTIFMLVLLNNIPWLLDPFSPFRNEALAGLVVFGVVLLGSIDKLCRWLSQRKRRKTVNKQVRGA